MEISVDDLLCRAEAGDEEAMDLLARYYESGEQFEMAALWREMLAHKARLVYESDPGRKTGLALAQRLEKLSQILMSSGRSSDDVEIETARQVLQELLGLLETVTQFVCVEADRRMLYRTYFALGRLSIWQARYRDAARWLSEAAYMGKILAQNEDPGDIRELCRCLEILADAWRSGFSRKNAVQVLLECEQWREKLVPLDDPKDLYAMACVCRKLGLLNRNKEYFRKALALIRQVEHRLPEYAHLPQLIKELERRLRNV